MNPSSGFWGKESRGRPQDKILDSLIISGYNFRDQLDFKSSCAAWARVWDQFLLRLSPTMKSCDLAKEVYDGSFFLQDWIQDFCADLHNLALEDSSAATQGVEFCTQVLDQFPLQEELFLENFRASLGEFHFLAGQKEAGELVLTALIQDLPHRSVGYAYLADMLGDGKFNPDGDQPLDLARAVEILEQGLAYPVEDAEDYDLPKRLRWLREDWEKSHH